MILIAGLKPRLFFRLDPKSPMWYNRAVHENVFQFLRGVHMNYPLYKKTSCMIFETDLIGTRFTLGLAELIWAFTLFWPGNTFDRPTYEVM